MFDFLSREIPILGENGVQKLQNSSVLVVGLGGVGSYVAEALVRGGIGSIALADGDAVQLSNLNRQICALRSTIGKNKAEVVAERARDINPDCGIKVFPFFYNDGNSAGFNLSSFDYIVDAIDSVSDKLHLIESAYKSNVPIISAMGAGNKAHPEMFEVADINKTTVCPLAKVIRRELKARGVVAKLKVVYSKEEPFATTQEDGKRVTGSLSFVPGAMGLIMAGEVIRDLIKE